MVDSLKFSDAVDIISNQLTVARLTLHGENFLDSLEQHLDSVRYEAAMDHLRSAVTELEQLHNIMKTGSRKEDIMQARKSGSYPGPKRIRRQ